MEVVSVTGGGSRVSGVPLGGEGMVGWSMCHGALTTGELGGCAVAVLHGAYHLLNVSAVHVLKHMWYCCSGPFYVDLVYVNPGGPFDSGYLLDPLDIVVYESA